MAIPLRRFVSSEDLASFTISIGARSVQTPCNVLLHLVSITADVSIHRVFLVHFAFQNTYFEWKCSPADGRQSSPGDLLCNIAHASGRITDPLQEMSHP